MIVKELLFDEEARRKLEKGIDTLANAVKITLGPKGRNVVLDRGLGSPLITNDGVSIAKEIELEDPFENMGAKLIKEVAIKANDLAGDGTTTSTILAQALVKEGLKIVSAGANPMFIKKGIEKTVEKVVEELQKKSKKVESNEEIESIARISAGDKEIGSLIAGAMARVGDTGVITVEEARTFETTLEIVEGLEFDNGYISSYMADPIKMMAEKDNPYILVTDKKISNIKDILPILEEVIKSGRALLLIAEELEGEALATIVMNCIRGSVNLVAVKAPSFGHRRKSILEDICVLTGATFISEEKGMKLSEANMSYLGTAKKIRVTKEKTTIIDGAGDKNQILDRIELIKSQLEIAETEYDVEKYQERIGKLSGGVAIIKIGAVTETEMKEKKLRLEDALNATRAAIEEGIVSGGGVALTEISKTIEDFKLLGEEGMGCEIVKKALLSPLKQIAINAGVDGGVVAEKVKTLEEGYGYNAATGEYVHMLSAGIIDPAKVTRSAIQNAASIAALILTTEVIIVDKKEKKN